MRTPLLSLCLFRARIAAGLALYLTVNTACLVDAAAAVELARQYLPSPVVDPRSTEICMNSRVSYHRGWSGTASAQAMGDILHAAAQAPTTGGPRRLYVATPQNVYLYDATDHSLVLHEVGDARADATAAFEVGFAAANYIDAGAAMHLAQLESIALWTGTSGQLASCPRGDAVLNANNRWNPTTPIQIVVAFGLRNVQGFTSTLVAISSDGSLSNPMTDGSVYLDDAVAGLASVSAFTDEEPTPAEISQLLWASYGCSDHRATYVPNTAGLVCASGLARYFLTRRIYLIKSEAVYRYHMRLPPGTDQTTRDHRIELVQAGDARAALRAAVPAVPEAPVYLVLCIGSTGQLPELEVGFVAVGAMLQASSLGLGAMTTAELSASQQSAIRVGTGIPSADLPMALVSLGHPVVTAVESGPGTANGLRMWIMDQPGSGGQVTIRYALPTEAPVTLSVYDVFGHRVRDIAALASGIGVHTVVWDGRDNQGATVSSGIYFVRLIAAAQQRTARALVMR